jgi:hypothetical protein
MSGLFLNSYPLDCSGSVRLFCLTGATARRPRRDLQDDLGVSVRVQDGQAFTYARPAAGGAETIDHSLSPVDDLAMFAIREALVEHCAGLGVEALIGRAGELRVTGLIASAAEDRFRIEHVLHLRVGREEFIDADAVLTARHRTAWRCAQPLTDRDVAARAVNERAVRVRGDGPRRGRVVRVGATSAVLRCGADEVEVAAADYTLGANAALIARWRGSAVLRRVRVTAGDLTVNGSRNKHGIEDRFKLVGDAVRRLGGRVAVGEHGAVTIAVRPVQIRLESRP